jgi:hypothetical protein
MNCSICLGDKLSFSGRHNTTAYKLARAIYMYHVKNEVLKMIEINTGEHKH